MKSVLRSLVLAVLAVPFAGIAPAPAATRKAPATTAPGLAGAASGQMRVRLPDVAVASVTIELISTTQGQPGVEFPADRLRISGTVRDIGAVKSPAAFRVKLVKDLHNVVATQMIPAPTAPGQSWTLVHEDTYNHGRAPNYRIVVETTYSESSTSNNSLDLNLRDAVLHSQGRQDTSDPTLGQTGPQLPGSVIVLF